MRLNAPYGAPCFLTRRLRTSRSSLTCGLNAPYGAPCFLTNLSDALLADDVEVLMHLMALRAFWRNSTRLRASGSLVLMHLMALRAFWLPGVSHLL